MQLIIGSRNVHKIRELRSMLKGNSQFDDIFSLIDFPAYEPPEESGNTFEENALIKATHAAKALDSWVLADDSGLVVPALNGAPGVRSARYAGDNASDLDNRKKLLREMKNLKDQERQGYFECCMVMASPKRVEAIASARCEGYLIEEERGGQGFGYDPLFLKHDYKKTFAELEEKVKNQISHRRKALDRLLMALETRLYV